MHSASAGRQPGSAWQRMPPPGATVQRPLQQASPVAQVSPSTRHPASSTQVMTPLSLRSAQPRPQHSSAFMQVSPAGRQSAAIAHMLPMQVPLQQSCAAAQGPSGARCSSRRAQTPAAHPRRAAGAGVRAALLVRRATGRVRADARPRPGGIRRADERAAVGARNARPRPPRGRQPPRRSRRRKLPSSTRFRSRTRRRWRRSPRRATRAER